MGMSKNLKGIGKGFESTSTNTNPSQIVIEIKFFLMNRWSTIQLATNKFCGCFDQIERLNQSGLTEKDKV